MPTVNVQASNEKADDPNKAGEGDNKSDDPYLGTWKTKEAAEVGMQNMQSLLDNQGNELGGLRKQVDFLQQQPKAPAKAAPAEEETGPDYGAEMKAVQKQMSELDPDDPEYSKEMGKLVVASNAIAAKDATQKAVAASKAVFKAELDERDAQAMHRSFIDSNPDFNTPEMQFRIQEKIDKDQTGMSDPVSAYREIQRDDAMAKLAVSEEANTEKDRLLGLKQGENETGKVVTKGQSTQQKTNQKKAVGADLDAGMLEALNNAPA